MEQPVTATAWKIVLASRPKGNRDSTDWDACWTLERWSSGVSSTGEEVLFSVPCSMGRILCGVSV
jgi:hypothetical protein